MLDRLFRIFKAENDRSQLVVIMVIAICVQFIFASFGEAIINSLLQFGVSWLVAFLYSKFVKSSNSTMIQWWKRIYIILIVFSLLRFIFA